MESGNEWAASGRDTLAADDISVTSTYVVTRVCAANDEDCESTGYDATFVVKKGKRVQTVGPSVGVGVECIAAY